MSEQTGLATQRLGQTGARSALSLSELLKRVREKFSIIREIKNLGHSFHSILSHNLKNDTSFKKIHKYTINKFGYICRHENLPISNRLCLQGAFMDLNKKKIVMSLIASLLLGASAFADNGPHERIPPSTCGLYPSACAQLSAGADNPGDGTTLYTSGCSITCYHGEQATCTPGTFNTDDGCQLVSDDSCTCN